MQTHTYTRTHARTRMHTHTHKQGDTDCKSVACSHFQPRFCLPFRQAWRQSLRQLLQVPSANGRLLVIGIPPTIVCTQTHGVQQGHPNHLAFSQGIPYLYASQYLKYELSYKLLLTTQLESGNWRKRTTTWRLNSQPML